MGIFGWLKGPQVERERDFSEYKVRLEENPLANMYYRWSWELLDDRGATVSNGNASTEAQAQSLAQKKFNDIKAYYNRTVKVISLDEGE